MGTTERETDRKYQNGGIIMNPYKLRTQLNLINCNTEITREDFDSLFYRTNEQITFTFNGWEWKEL